MSAGSPSAVYRAGKFVRRHKLGIGVAASIVVALALGLILALWGLGRATRAEQLAQRRLEDVSREAAKSRAVNAFLTDMLESADPFRAEKGDLTVRDAMEGAVRRLEAGALAGQPHVEEAIRATIGGVLQSLGRLDTAVEQLRRARDAARARSGGADDAELARALNLLGMALAERGELDEAERVTREALEMRTRLYGERSWEAAESTGNLASISADRGDHAAAEPLYRRALAVYEALPVAAFGADARSAAMTRASFRATAMSNLARSLRALGRAEEAERLYRQAIDESRAALGADHPTNLLPMNNLARVMLEQRRFAEAEQVEREALRVARAASLPSEHLDALLAAQGLATALLAQGKLDEAEPLYRELAGALRPVSDANGAGMLGDALSGYWSILVDRRRLDEAEAVARELLDLGHSSASARGTALAQARLAYVYARRGQKLDEAESLIRAALSPPEKLALPETSWVLHSYRGTLGDVLLRRGQTAEAAPLILKSHEVITADPTAMPRAKRDAVERLARLYDAQGKSDDAARLRAALASVGPATSVAPTTAPAAN